MRFASALIGARLIRRYKRFLADMELDTGEQVTVHCANPGAMLGLLHPGGRAWLSRSANQKRKLALSWELAEADFGAGPELVGINTALPNTLVDEALCAGAIATLAGYPQRRREVAYGQGSRVDFLLGGRGPPCYVEVKNVHLMRRPGLAEFPDSRTARGARHLEELAAMVAQGARAVTLFVVQIASATRFTPARDLDPRYAAAFDAARRAGVEMLACRCSVSTDAIVIDRPIAVE